MQKIPQVCLVLAGVALFGACSSEDAPVNATGGAPSSSSGSGGGSVVPPSGGAAGTAAVTGGTASSGAAGAPGGVGGSGAAGASAGTSAGGMSGAGTAGAAGSSGSGGGGGGGTPVASAGCNKAERPAGGTVTVAGKYYFAFPESYDGKKPLPVLLGFHGCGDSNRGTGIADTEFMRLTEGTAFKSEYVRVVPISEASGGCWTYGTDMARVTKMYDDLVANYCVDTSRVFATGHSSGSQFLVQVFTNNHSADAQHLKIKAIAPVAASDYGAMKGPIPAMYIQGKMDSQRGGGDGHETVARLRAANSCMDSSKPYSQVMGCQSGQTMVDPGCISYDGCTVPTIWCSHNDPAYSGTMHGVPCFGMKAMHDFFNSLP